MRPIELVGIELGDGREVFINPFQVGHIIDVASGDPSTRTSIVSMRNGSEIPLPLPAFKVARKVGIAGRQNQPLTR